jgi:arginase family enzyme
MIPHPFRATLRPAARPSTLTARRAFRPALRSFAFAAQWFGLCLAAGAASADWSVPFEHRGKVAALPPEQQAFLTSGAALEFLPAVQLAHEVATRDADALVTMVGDLMALADRMGFDPATDLGAMPLNIESRGFNGHRVVTPPLLAERQRAPGPFGVHRYQFPVTGVPTFAGARVAITPQDLIAGAVDVAIVGVPNDMGSGRRNAEYGPRVMRALNTVAEPDVLTLVDPVEVLTVVDYGDFSIDNMSTERSVDHVTEMVAETAATGAVPMLVGGDTSMLYPGVKGVSRALGTGAFGLVHFGAHADAHRTAVHTVSDTQAIFLLLEEGVIDGEDLVQVGLRGPSVDAETLQWLRDRGVRYHTMAEVRTRGFGAVLDRVLDEALAGPARTFVSIDVSVIEPTEMVAAGRATANGLRIQQAAAAIRHLCAAKEIVGFELTDMAPMLDFSRLSAINANTLLNACLVGMAVREAGYGPEDVHPLALDHGQE